VGDNVSYYESPDFFIRRDLKKWWDIRDKACQEAVSDALRDERERLSRLEEEGDEAEAEQLSEWLFKAEMEVEASFCEAPEAQDVHAGIAAGEAALEAYERVDYEGALTFLLEAVAAADRGSKSYFEEAATRLVYLLGNASFYVGEEAMIRNHLMGMVTAARLLPLPTFPSADLREMAMKALATYEDGLDRLEEVLEEAVPGGMAGAEALFWEDRDFHLKVSREGEDGWDIGPYFKAFEVVLPH
jgi:hypothetical protein